MDNFVTDTDLNHYELGFGDGYQDYLDRIPCAYEVIDGTLCNILGGFNVRVRRPDYYYALGVLRGWEQAREDDH